ncbi:UNVERIFIED_CONTAM: hypothetical protein Sindi_0823600 [Sesamum indicum]
MSSSNESIHFLKEVFASDNPSKATSKRVDPVPLHFWRGFRKSLRQATDKEEEGENEGEGSSPEGERVRSSPEEAETPESSAMDEPSASILGEIPSEEKEEEEKVSQSPSDWGPLIL